VPTGTNTKRRTQAKMRRGKIPVFLQRKRWNTWRILLAVDILFIAVFVIFINIFLF
jgi:hypothetical protein